MKVVYNQKINKIAKLFIPDDLRLEGLVVAGGFGAYLYYLSLKTDSELDKIYKNLVLKTNSFRDADKNIFISDIDYWILEGSPAHQYFSLIAPSAAEDTLPILNKNDFKNLENVCYSHYINGSKSFGAGKLSKYALTLVSNSVKTIDNAAHLFSEIYNHQIIRFAVWADIESIISNFDLDICQVAWYKDNLYVSESAFENFVKKEISFNKNLKLEKDSTQSIWSVNRLFKYLKRYEFSIKKEDVISVFEFYSYALEYSKDFNQNVLSNNAKSVLINPPSLPVTPATPTPLPVILKPTQLPVALSPAQILQIGKPAIGDDEEYSPGNSDKYKLYSGYLTLINYLPLLFSLDNFESHRAAYLLGYSDFADALIKKYFDLVSDLNQGAK